ncbi:MAG: AAA family ATPase [Candidatus Marsarchaeota archaeon]|nr:AAA family ATPase [Candidatus Marsarchaeota archaeon]MCL5413212.1 AAA family ATPase [Candidatus Marsarchaeota archaeon]
MDNDTFSKLVIASEKAISGSDSFPVKRYLFNSVDKSSTKFYTGIYGLRGVGKTIMLLQLAKKRRNALYIPADAKYLLQDDIYETVNYAIDRGYEAIFLDEIHSRTGWTSDLKTLYDEGKANLFFTGSSSIELRKGADLSRRAIMHELKPASFREYLNIRYGANIEAVSVNDLYEKQKRQDLVAKYGKWNAFVEEYYKYGGVLYEGVKEEFPKPITNALEKIISVDLSYLRELDIKVENDIYKLLFKITESGLYEVSYSKLAGYLAVSKSTVIKLVTDLERLGLFKLVYPCGTGFRKEPKIYLSIPFRSALNEMSSKHTDMGTLREEFFADNVEVDGYLKTERGEKTPDFKVKGRTVEVGGERKRSIDADYIAVHGLSFNENRIPLFLFGFLY